jgi:hypothetical protein
MLWLLELPVLILGFWALLRLSLLLSVKQKAEQFSSALLRLDSAAYATVKEIQQTLAEDFKRARVEQRLKGDTAAELRATAIKILYANLGPIGLHELRRALGLKRKAPIDRLLVGRIEAALFDIKRGAPRNEQSEIPSAPGKRFYPETMRIPKVDQTTEDHKNLFDEPTHITGR